MASSLSLSSLVTLALGLSLAPSVTWVVDASSFLGPVPVHLESNLEGEHVLLTEIESVLGSEHRTFTEKRLASIKRAVLPIFTAMPKNEHGKLGHAATSYALYRIFVQRHAWFVTGLEPFKAMAAWNSSSATAILEQRVPEYITGLFHSRMGRGGFGVHEVAVLAATLEHLVHKESLLRLGAAYRSLVVNPEDVLSSDEVEQVLDSYMSLYILGPLVRNISTVRPEWVRALRANVTKLYPSFPQTQSFLRDVQESMAPNRDYFYFSDVTSLVEEVGDRYGRWQDYECQTLKNMLVDMEDPGTGGAGRVRLADFYGAALERGKWQLCENVEYLRQLGALDESDADDPRVIIPNYINGPSNCVASSSYYSVCCINECDELVGQIEGKLAAPDASPAQIAAMVAGMPSSTVPSNRTLSQWLLHRLGEAAQHHGGRVPLHGRLFSQWMHYAYPRECPYPHVLGATRPQTADSWVREFRKDFAANKTEMRRYVERPVARKARAAETGAVEEVSSMESAMWTMDEELVVWRPATPSPRGSWSVFSAPALAPVMRGLVFVAALVSATLGLLRASDTKISGLLHGNDKYFV